MSDNDFKRNASEIKRRENSGNKISVREKYKSYSELKTKGFVIMNIFKKTDFITVPYMEFVDYVNVIGPVEGVCLRPGKIRNHIVSQEPRKTEQYIDIIFWGYKKNVNAAKAKLLEFEYSRCNRYA